MTTIQTPAIVRRPDVTGDRTYWFLHNLATVLVRGAETADGLGLVEMLGARGDMPPLHVHHEEDEVFLVLEGSLSLWVGDRTATIGAGETALAPRGVPHVYRVESERARWLALVTPSRFDRFVEEVGAPAESLELPPETVSLPDPAHLVERAAAVGIEILGPPGTLPG